MHTGAAHCPSLQSGAFAPFASLNFLWFTSTPGVPAMEDKGVSSYTNGRAQNPRFVSLQIKCLSDLMCCLKHVSPTKSASKMVSLCPLDNGFSFNRLDRIHIKIYIESDCRSFSHILSSNGTSLPESLCEDLSVIRIRIGSRTQASRKHIAAVCPDPV